MDLTAVQWRELGVQQTPLTSPASPISPGVHHLTDRTVVVPHPIHIAPDGRAVFGAAARATPALHVLGLPHTITSNVFSHCAFTGKVKRFSPMLRACGFKVVHYGNEGAESGANEHVDILSHVELEGFLGKYDSAAAMFVGNRDAHVESPLYREYNRRLGTALAARVEPGDVICCPFGHAHEQALFSDPWLLKAYWLETGVGYPTLMRDPTAGRSGGTFKVFESCAWYHWHAGRGFQHGDYTWVIPNYFDLTEWEPSYEPGQYLLYFGRICAVKGLHTIVEIARQRPDLKVILCGQGDPREFLTLPNVEYHAPVHGRDRAELLRKAIALLVPSAFIEPFGGVAVEAMLCGTPAITTSFGAFTETIRHGVSGWRCHVLGDWLEAVKTAEAFNDRARRRVRLWAERYDMRLVGADYERVIRQITGLGQPQGDWYRKNPIWVGV